MKNYNKILYHFLYKKKFKFLKARDLFHCEMNEKDVYLKFSSFCIFIAPIGKHKYTFYRYEFLKVLDFSTLKLKGQNRFIRLNKIMKRLLS